MQGAQIGWGWIGNSIVIAKFFGIEIRADLTWAAVAGLLVWALGSSHLPEALPGLNPLDSWSLALGLTVFLYSSLVAHELGHGLAAARLGLPVESIRLFALGGLAQFKEEPRHPRQEVLIAAAGPAVTLALAGGFGGLSYLASWVSNEKLAFFGRWLATANLWLGLLNLVPGLPLDGGRILRGWIWGLSGNGTLATQVAGWTGKLTGVGILTWGLLNIIRGDAANGLWLLLIGWFIYGAASQAVTQVLLRSELRQLTAREVMLSDCPAVKPAMTLIELVERQVQPGGRSCFPVIGSERVIGVITLDDLRGVPRSRWSEVTVGSAMKPLRELPHVAPNAGALQVMQRMHEARQSYLAVVDNGIWLGTISLHQLATRRALNGAARR